MSDERRDSRKPDRRTGSLKREGGRRAGDVAKIRCPVCSSPKSTVIRSRPGGKAFGGRVDTYRRRRVCRDCGSRFTTEERLVLPKPKAS